MLELYNKRRNDTTINEDEHKQYAVQKEENSKKTEEIKSLAKENEKLIANKNL